ncbi:MAG TPA: hypothetical protein VIH87_00815 [Methylocella sp.]
MFFFRFHSLWIGATTIVASAAIFLGLGSGQAQQTQEEQASPPQYESLVKGIAASSPLQIQFKSAPLRLEIRNLVMGRGDTEAIPTPTRILMEVRQGAITTTINDEKHDWRQGDFSMVDKGSLMTIQNPGEVAVIRAIYIYEGNR